MTPTGIIDSAHFNEAMREVIFRDLAEADRLVLSPLIERPWLFR
jgi:hypothetical protein